MRRLVAIVTAVVTLAVVVPASPAAAQQPQREPFPVRRVRPAALATWKVPGVAIAIVRNDSVVYAKGYGVREIGKPAPVDERTLFAIGSSSKAFTAAAVAMLVDSGKVRLDAPAAAYLPGFQLNDPFASREITVRDLLSHRSGLARGELIWYGSGRSTATRSCGACASSSRRGASGRSSATRTSCTSRPARWCAKTADTCWDDFISSASSSRSA